jgi:ATP-dependent exoDNAse (exonuclease V) beta subunit
VFVLQEDIGAQIKNLSAEIASTMDEPVGLDDACSILERFLEKPAIHPFFESRDGRSVLTEQEIVDAQGRLFRLDRIIVDVGAASVVDYKTGGDSAEYDEQILNYMNLLEQLYPNKAVHGFLAFIDRRSIREVLR